MAALRTVERPTIAQTRGGTGGWFTWAVLICTWGLMCVPTGLQAAEDWNVLPTVPDSPAGGRLYRWLQDQAKLHFDRRRQAIAALKTPEDVQRRQKALREQFLAALGGFPERTPLSPQITGQIERPDYRIEKVIYESRPHHHITANLYLPVGKGPFPGVIMPCGTVQMEKLPTPTSEHVCCWPRTGLRSCVTIRSGRASVFSYSIPWVSPPFPAVLRSIR